MRIASLAPFLTEILVALDLQDSLVAVSAASSNLPGNGVAVVGGGPGAGLPGPFVSLSRDLAANLAMLRDAGPEVAFISLPKLFDDEQSEQAEVRRLEELLQTYFGYPVRLFNFTPRRLDAVLETFQLVGKRAGQPQRGHDLHQRSKARIMDWVDNFFERMRTKRVLVLAGIEPFMAAGLWIPDMVQLASCSYYPHCLGQPHKVITWPDIQSFRPDVLLVAPQGLKLEESMQTFKTLERIPEWETLPAVKRGEVFFCDGIRHFYSPDPNIVESMGILISVIAGLDSGYITARDLFHRLRWLELQRHRI